MKIKFYRIFKCKMREDKIYHTEDEQPTTVAFSSKDEADKYCFNEGNKKYGIVYTSKLVEVELFKTYEESQEQEQELSK